MIAQTQHTVPVPFLPESLRGFRVVQLSDLHRSYMTPDYRLRSAVDMANALCPDITVITGDLVTQDKADIEPCAQIVSGLQARLGVYAILGNHDYYTDGPKVTAALRRVGIHVLINQSVRLSPGLWLVGLDEDRHGKPDIAKAFSDIPAEEAVLALVHNPAYAEKLSDRHCIAFAGHTHGGQIRLPVLTPRELRRIGAKHYRAGWYTLDKARLYVNRGLGQVGLPVRFFCRPELSVFTLIPR